MEKQTLIKERNFSDFNEKIYEFDHKSGLHVQIIPKKGFAKKFAVLTTDFGSIDTKYLDENNETITVPEVHPLFAVSTQIVPVQLLSYHIARLRGCDIDKPRNLAKSVTVE